MHPLPNSGISEAQQAANERNAKLSSGPRTDQGKQRSRYNGVRHSLTGKTIVLPAERLSAYNRHCADIRNSLDVVGPVELNLGQSIADDFWRIGDAAALIANCMAIVESGLEYTLDDDPKVDDGFRQAWAYQGAQKDLDRITIYESRINRNLKTKMALLKEVQAERRAKQAKELEEAKLLAQLALSKGETYDPSKDFGGHHRSEHSPANSGIHRNGFAFSAAQINCLLDRENRLNEARKLAGLDRNPKTPLKKAA